MPDPAPLNEQPSGGESVGPTSPLVRADRLTKSYGDHEVLTDVSCEIHPGVTGLLGANGAGKTTFLGLILGLHRPTGGSLEVLGRSPADHGPELRERIGYGPEHHRLPPNLRAVDFVRHIGEIHGLPPTEATTRASDALWLVDLGEERFRPMGTMSTGQRQRVKLAQAIVHDPTLVLLDEPTDGLDPAQREVMLALIRSVVADFGISVIISSHLIDEVERVCDRAVVIGAGRVVADGRIDELRTEDSTMVLLELDASDDQIYQLGKELQDDLEEEPVEIEVRGRELTVIGGDDRILDLVLGRCVDRNIGLVRLHHRGRSLEDVLVEALA